MGGGALFFELARLELLQGEVFLSDANKNLIDAYLGVRDEVERVLDLLREHASRHCQEHYYHTRAQLPQSLAERAARVIYLNKTCYNGLFRENRQGLFNVPLGRYKNPSICDEANLRAASETLQPCHLAARPFDESLRQASPGDLIYFDPPYHPVSKTASFTAYSQHKFGEDAQWRLAESFKELARQGVKALLSNSMTELVRRLYQDFTIEEVLASRSVNSRAMGRGKVAEALVRNFH